MLRPIGVILMLLPALILSAQLDPKKQQVYRVPAIIEDGDTIPYVQLNSVEIYALSSTNKQEFDRVTRNVVRAYPYARLTAETMAEMDSQLARITSKKERKKYIEWAEKEMKSAFEKDLRKLTYSQGRMLIKLVNRETGKTGYELVKELKGGFSAFMWQGVAKLFGANLKDEFDGKKEDEYVNFVVQRIERGEIAVARIEKRNLAKAN